MKSLAKQFVLLILLGVAIAPQTRACNNCEGPKNGGCPKLYAIFGEFFDKLTQDINLLNELNRNSPTNDFIKLAAGINDNVCSLNIFTQNSSRTKKCPISEKIIQTTTMISHATSWLILKSLSRNYPELERTRTWMTSHFEILQKNITNPPKE